MLFLFFQAEAGIRDAHLGLGFRRVLFRSLAEEKLILVTTDAGGALLPEQYVYVDWGPAFAANHQAAFPELSSPPVSISLGPLALGYLLSVGGSGYFRVGAARPFLDSGRLRRVAGAPALPYSAYARAEERRVGKEGVRT